MSDDDTVSESESEGARLSSTSLFDNSGSTILNGIAASKKAYDGSTTEPESDDDFDTYKTTRPLDRAASACILYNYVVCRLNRVLAPIRPLRFFLLRNITRRSTN